ncbi:conserved Plasmodium protein, unknown function [Plasmodium sp. DRC-Itaito]|nr:conserved Plasmodium protein, unknown function [Plasmodium sp. DRC-Itaito]
MYGFFFNKNEENKLTKNKSSFESSDHNINNSDINDNDINDNINDDINDNINDDINDNINNSDINDDNINDNINNDNINNDNINDNDINDNINDDNINDNINNDNINNDYINNDYINNNDINDNINSDNINDNPKKENHKIILSLDEEKKESNVNIKNINNNQSFISNIDNINNTNIIKNEIILKSDKFILNSNDNVIEKKNLINECTENILCNEDNDIHINNNINNTYNNLSIKNYVNFLHKDEKKEDISSNNINVSNSKNDIKKNHDTLIQENINTLSNSISANKEKEINKNDKISDHINIDLFYTSDNSVDISDENSSLDTMEELCENIEDSDVSINFYKNMLSSKNNINDNINNEPSIINNNNPTEEINILNNYIKNITDGYQNHSSSSIDLDNKLLNILSLSFLTFVDNVIYDSHIYAQTNTYLDTTKMKLKKTHESNKTSQICQESNVITQHGNNKNNDTITQNVQRIYNKNVDLLNTDIDKNDTQGEKRKLKNYNNDDDQNKLSEYFHHIKEKPSDITFNPDVINMCLNNLYNEQLVNKLIHKRKKKKKGKDKDKDKTEENHMNDTKNNNNNNHNNNNNNNSNYISSNDDDDELRFLSYNSLFNKKTNKDHTYQQNNTTTKNIKVTNNINDKKSIDENNKSLQYNIYNKLNKRKIMINQINDEIKKKNNNYVKTFTNNKPYTLEDIFEI